MVGHHVCATTGVVFALSSSRYNNRPKNLQRAVDMAMYWVKKRRPRPTT